MRNVIFLENRMAGERTTFRDLSLRETFILPEIPDVVYMRYSLLQAMRLNGPNAEDILQTMKAEQPVIVKLFDLKEVEYWMEEDECQVE
jgi:hypothetical protein